MIKFTKERVLLIYKYIVTETGGSFGIRDESLLESAIEAPYQTFDGKELYPTKIEKGARLGFGLIKNHPFIDGNKPIGFHIMHSFLEINGIKIDFSDIEIENIAMKIASGEISYEKLKEILIEKHKNIL